MHFFFYFLFMIKNCLQSISVPNIQTPKKWLSYFFFAEETFVHVMHITDKKTSFDIFTVGNLPNKFMEHDLYLIS